jgi:hypothetical protein
MKIDNESILIMLLSFGIVLASIYAVLGRSTMTPGESGGYMIMMDQKVSESDYNSLGYKSFTTTALLPSDDCEGVVTSCSFNFPENIGSKEDINGDGIIDYTDLYFAVKSYGCRSGQTCWTDSIQQEDCYFTYSGRTFKDPYPSPDKDCHITQDDIQAVADQFGKINDKVTDSNCDLYPVCRADLNKDGKIDIYDVALVSANLGRWADVFVNYGFVKKSDANVNGDVIVDISDIATIAKHLGTKASQQKCTTSTMTALGNRQYQVTAYGKGLYFVSLSYRCK